MSCSQLAGNSKKNEVQPDEELEQKVYHVKKKMIFFTILCLINFVGSTLHFFPCCFSVHVWIQSGSDISGVLKLNLNLQSGLFFVPSMFSCAQNHPIISLHMELPSAMTFVPNTNGMVTIYRQEGFFFLFRFFKILHSKIGNLKISFYEDIALIKKNPL